MTTHPDYPAAERRASAPLATSQKSFATLELTNDWLESSTSYLSADYPHDLDFQSNHLSFTCPHSDSESWPLSGLGIRNIDMTTDLSSIDRFISEAVDNFDDSPIHNAGDLYPENFDMFSRNRSENDLDTLFDIPMPLSSNSLRDSWSVASISKAPGLATDSSTDLDSSISIESKNLPAQISFGFNSRETLSFEELSATTGLSVADFAAHISATAEIALRNLAKDDLTLVEPNEADSCESLFQANDNEIAPQWFAADFVLPFENSVRQNRTPIRNNTCYAVNPADIFSTSQATFGIPEASATRLLGSSLPDPFSRNELEDMPRNGNSEGPSFIQKSIQLEGEAHQLSENEHSAFQSPSSSEYSPSIPGDGLKTSMPLRVNRRRITRRRLQSDLPVFESPQTPTNCNENPLVPINLGTPVFDAHRGIDIEVLKEKAERYRLRNQGREYDKRWLISFAGKLSHRGELVDEFRCYVKGCKQTNKRRDHILIHVGAHLDQRPFKCMYCSSRFLRKNECKRHELSHTGIRPFSCHLCPNPTTTFVRQDLLKRHMKRTHRLHIKSEKENETPDRPKKRSRS